MVQCQIFVTVCWVYAVSSYRFLDFSKISLPHDKSLKLSILKTIADDKLDIVHMVEFVSQS